MNRFLRTFPWKSAPAAVSRSREERLRKVQSDPTHPGRRSSPHRRNIYCWRLRISYISQDTSYLRGTLSEFAAEYGLDGSLFRTVLAKLGLERSQFETRIETYSEGQKKKVLLAKSLCEPAHLFIWDEPLNYIDIFSRIQLEDLLLSCCPTMLFVEHDRTFREKIATETISL